MPIADRGNAYHKARRLVDKEVYLERERAQTVKRKALRAAQRYGITIEEYHKLMEQPTCEICGSTGNAKALHIDHCHTTGKVRGVLCYKCNQAMGMLEDNIEIIDSMAAYLVRTTT